MRFSWRIARIAMSVALTLSLYTIVFLVIYPQLRAFESEFLILLPLTLVSVMTVIYLFYWLRRYSSEKDELYRRAREYERILGGETHTFRVFDALRDAQILHSSGDAIIRYSARCVNSPETELRKIRIAVSHDGDLDENSLKCAVNGHEMEIEDIERFQTLDISTRKPRKRLANELRFYIVSAEPIAKGARFEYGYSYRAGRLFKDMTEGESMGTIILHPTARVHYNIRVPSGFIFKSYSSKVLDREEIENAAEIERIERECPPTLSSDKGLLTWNLLSPQLGNIYRLNFTVEPTESSNRRQKSNP